MMSEKPLRIAHVMGKCVGGGGVEAVVLNYYRHIDKNKIQFDFICDSDSPKIPYEEVERLGGRIILVPPYQKIFLYRKQLLNILKKYKYCIIHSHINTLSVFPLSVAKKANIPIRIAHSHSTTNKKEFIRNVIKQVLRPFSKKYATHYFACSKIAGIWQFGKKEYDKGNVVILNNAIDVDKFKYNKDVRQEIRKELGIRDNMLVLGHIGRFVTVKNHKFLVKIFKSIHDKKADSVLLMAGNGPLMDEIKEQVNNLGLSDSVMFLNLRTDAERLYQAFDIFVLPSLYEGLPVVGVEAQAAGVPCFLSSSVTSETKILNKTQFISLDKTPDEWCKLILANYNLEKRKNTAKELINKNFSIKDEAKKLEKKYFDLLNDINKG